MSFLIWLSLKTCVEVTVIFDQKCVFKTHSTGKLSNLLHFLYTFTSNNVNDWGSANYHRDMLFVSYIK